MDLTAEHHEQNARNRKQADGQRGAQVFHAGALASACKGPVPLV